MTSVALLLGVSFGAQLEAVRAGVPSPVAADREEGPGADRRTVSSSPPSRPTPGAADPRHG